MQLSPESQKAIQDQQVKVKFDELTNLSRLAVNTLNLICSNDVKIPSAYAQPVAEIQQWLQGMHKGIQGQLETLQALLSKVEVTKAAETPKVAPVDAETPKVVALEVVANDTTPPEA